MTKLSLSGRERVRLALNHQETDRIPMAMVCSGINEPARTAFAEYLYRQRHCALDDYLDPIIDIKLVEPQYIGPRLKADTDIWGVKRMEVDYGQGTYDEIEGYPLASASSIDDIVRHSWPTADLFDYTVIPEQIRAIQAGGERCIMVSNGNVFESSWYMRGLEQTFMDMVLDPPLAHEIMHR